VDIRARDVSLMGGCIGEYIKYKLRMFRNRTSTCSTVYRYTYIVGKVYSKQC
jgi:hypothetical protein